VVLRGLETLLAVKESNVSLLVPLGRGRYGRGLVFFMLGCWISFYVFK